MERTLILVKPDAFARNLTGEIIARFENKGLRIAGLKHMQVGEDLAKQHYAEHEGKPFFGELVDFITSAPLVAMVLEGTDAIRAARQVIGATNPFPRDGYDRYTVAQALRQLIERDDVVDDDALLANRWCGIVRRLRRNRASNPRNPTV